MASLSSDVRDDIRRIAAEHGAARVLMFGSYAHGSATPHSDLDLILDMAPGRGLLDVIAIKQDIEEATGLRVDAVTPASISPYLRDRIMREAVPA